MIAASNLASCCSKAVPPYMLHGLEPKQHAIFCKALDRETEKFCFKFFFMRPEMLRLEHRYNDNMAQILRQILPLER